MDDVERLNLIAREITNGAWFFCNLSLWASFLYFVAVRVRDYRDAHSVGFRRAVSLFARGAWTRREIGDAAAVAMSVYMAGATIRAAYVWSLLITQNQGHSSADWLESSYWIMFLAAALAICGALCAQRIFTPAKWSGAAWVAALLLAVAVPILVHFLW